MNKWGFVDKLWRTVVGLIIMHPVLIWRAGRVFIRELQDEYSMVFRDLKEMWKKREHINRGRNRMLKNDEVDYCTKCTVKPIAKEHLCDDCYEPHNEWLPH